jgi:hypothetical protein
MLYYHHIRDIVTIFITYPLQLGVFSVISMSHYYILVDFILFSIFQITLR